jgi:hypothetical protein
MNTFVISSLLLAPPETFWREQIAGSAPALGADASSVEWPQSISQNRMTIFFAKYEHVRTVKRRPGGCEVSDQVSFKPWGAPLGAWLKATQIIRFREEHAKFHSKYGKA